jgi:hypothetical protein
MSTLEKKPDLESAICDVAEMSNVCIMVLETLERQEESVAKMKFTATEAAEYMTYWRETISFALHHLDGMIKDLKTQFYASPE